MRGAARAALLTIAALMWLVPSTAHGQASREALLAAAPAAAKPLPEAAVRAAIRYNQRRFSAAHLAEITAWLRGPSGSDTGPMTAADVAVIERLQRAAGFTRPDGRLGNRTMAALLMAGLELSAVPRVRPRQVELLFYPGTFEDTAKWREARDHAGTSQYRAVMDRAPSGSGALYVAVDGVVVDLARARGGPPFQLVNRTHTADPSKPGRYRLERGKPYRTRNWLYGQIPWGAELREQGGEIEYRPRGEKRWKLATGPKRSLDHEIPRAEFYGPDGALFPEWRLNEFGSIAWRLRGSPGLLIHTTPATEDATARGADPALATSHGCLHVKPSERDRLVERGYLVKGATVVIKRYRDHLLPAPMRARLAAGT